MTGLLCEEHVAALTDLLVDVRELFEQVMLDSLIPLASAPPSSGSKRTKQADPPAPVSLDVLAMTDWRNADHPRSSGGDGPGTFQVPAGLLRWARWVCRERDLKGSTLDGTVDASVRFLQAHREWLAGQRAVIEYEAELRGMRRALAGMLGESKPAPVGRCPTLDGDGVACGGPLWPDPAGNMSVTCGKCDRTFDEKMLRHLGGLMEGQ